MACTLYIAYNYHTHVCIQMHTLSMDLDMLINDWYMYVYIAIAS